MGHKQKINLIDKLSKHLGTATDSGEEIRFQRCPACEGSKENASFSVNATKQVFKCHKCGAAGSLSNLGERLGIQIAGKKTLIKHPAEADLKRIRAAHEVWENAKVISRESKTAEYLAGRGIQWPTIKHLDIRENCKYFGIVGITNRKTELIGINCREQKSDSSIGKRYLGKKKGGAAILQDSESVIVAEGVVTGLAIFQKIGLRENIGLVIAGDAGNLPQIANMLKGKRRVLVCADNDIDGHGLQSALALYSQLGNRATLHVPYRKGTDWADVLKDGRWNHEWNS